MTLERLSPCKVNFLLNILGKRPDGFHELETLFHPVALTDRLATIGPALLVLLTLIVLGLLVGALLRAVVSRLARRYPVSRATSSTGFPDRLDELCEPIPPRRRLMRD